MKTTRSTQGIRHRKRFLLVCLVFGAFLLSGFQQPAVRVENADSVGPRSLDKQTATAVVHDYLQAWQSLSGALQDNRADLLDAFFVGLAKEKLGDVVREQQKLGIKTQYRDVSHDLELVFYSPEGLSVQLLDTVQYDVQVLDHDQVQATQHVRSSYIAVLTPTEVRWKVRVFQAKPE